MRKFWWLLLLLLAAPLALLAARATPILGTSRPRNLIIISIDTLRADHVGCYGHERPTTPAIDRMAAEGVLFEDSSATSPWTKPSHASMLTGLYPRRHGAIAMDRPMADDVEHLAALLSRQGFQTVGIVNNLWLAIHGLERGFDDFKMVNLGPTLKDPRSSPVTEIAINWLENRDRKKPFFAFLHWMDVHSDYCALEPYQKMFLEPYAGPADGSTTQLKRFVFGKVYLTARDFQHLRNRYDAGIRQLDDQLRNLFAYLESEGLKDNTLVVITSDHGEEFMDHGSAFHTHQQYQEVIRVPLIFRGPGIPANVRIAEAVSLIDLMPTCLALLDVPSPQGLDGVELQTLWQDRRAALEPRMLFAEADCTPIDTQKNELSPLGSKRMVRNEQFKLHYDTQTGTMQLFDLEHDPREQIDVKSKHPDVVEILRKHLDEFLSSRSTETQSESVDEVDMRTLKALGYVGG